MDNTSGGGASVIVPKEIKSWNWGAFFLSWIWGIGNNTLIALLAFVPFVGLAMPFVLGAKGSEWSWRNKRWESIEAFKATQRKWAFWGVTIFALFLALFVGLFFAIMVAMKSSDAYKLSVSELTASPEAVQLLGQPISTGFPSGGIQSSGIDGEANLSFSAEGPSGSGTVYVKAVKSMGQWHLEQAVLEDSKTGRRIEFGR